MNSLCDLLLGIIIEQNEFSYESNKYDFWVICPGMIGLEEPLCEIQEKGCKKCWNTALNPVEFRCEMEEDGNE